MKKFLLSAALLAGGTLGMQGLAFGHGGQYRGPGNTVPPGGGGGGGGGGPSSPGPSGPSSPGPAGPGSPGPAAPGSPGGGGSGPAAPVSGGGGDSGPDLTAWTFWWEFNKEPYINLKSHIHSGGVTTGSEGWFLGHGEKKQGKDSLRPTEQQIRQTVVPALIKALETETNNDIVTGCLIALAKIGDANTESGESEFEKIISQKLSDSVQEIRETAAVALGILANPNSIGTLESLLMDLPDGRSKVGGGEITFRTRSFAAYGLALIGARTSDPAHRQEIVKILATAMDADNTKSRDLAVSCLVALGLVPIDNIESETATPEGETAMPWESRTAQLDFIMGYLQDDENRYLVRAHAPTALARLLDQLPTEMYESYKEDISKDLLDRIAKRSKEKREVQQSAILALGLLGTAEEKGTDAEIRKAIANVPKDISDAQSRNFSMIAMAKAGSNIAGIADPSKGISEASKHLMTQLSKGSSQVKPWAGLSLGVMGRRLSDASASADTVASLQQVLRSSLKDEKNTSRVGAYAIACGILQDQEATSVMLEKLDRISDDTTRGYLAVALGLTQAREAVEVIQSIVKELKYRPELLKQAAISLGLLGDKELVDQLITMLSEAKGLATQAALSSALGFIGDQRSIDPLVAMLENQDLTDRARGFAAVALGIVADKEPLPWNSKIAIDLNYRAATETLNDTNGTGILNIL